MPSLPDKAIIIARLKKKPDVESEPEMGDAGSHEEDLAAIAKDLVQALEKKDVSAVRDLLCEFIDAHKSEPDGDEGEDE